MVDIVLGVLLLIFMAYALIFKVNNNIKSTQTLWMGIALVSLAMAIGILWTTKYSGLIFLLGLVNICFGLYQRVFTSSEKKEPMDTE